MDIPGFRGAILRPGQQGYDEARRVWNGAVDRHPRMIARCAGTADVVAAVRFAAERELLVAVRGGGHGVAGTATCDDGMVIDCSPMKGIRVDPPARTAWAQPGVLWGELDQETQAFGLAVTGGIVTHTGIAGLTLGGGLGWLMRKHGLTIDNLTAADVVTADGRLLRASAAEHPDLFWGLRGGGGNFGVVTCFEYRLHPLGPVLAGPVLWPIEQAAEVLRFYRDFIATVPDELTTIVNLRKAPPLPAIPQPLHGRPVCAVTVCWSGELAAGETLLRPLRRFGRPLLDLIAIKPYPTHQSMFDPLVPHGWHYYWKSVVLADLSDHTIDTLATHTAAIGSARSYVLIFQLGGAIARVATDATAYPHRQAGYAVNINAVWLPGEAIAGEERAWTRRLFTALEPAQLGVYVNFLGEEGSHRVRAAYGAATYQRLAHLKARYDPGNLFRLNQNIPPSTPAQTLKPHNPSAAGARFARSVPSTRGQPAAV